jgi:hypothetical protein
MFLSMHSAKFDTNLSYGIAGTDSSKYGNMCLVYYMQITHVEVRNVPIILRRRLGAFDVFIIPKRCNRMKNVTS